MAPGRFDHLVGFLEETDLVKFAKMLPSVAASEDLLSQSFRFVERTTPKTATPTEPTKGDTDA